MIRLWPGLLRIHNGLTRSCCVCVCVCVLATVRLSKCIVEYPETVELLARHCVWQGFSIAVQGTPFSGAREQAAILHVRVSTHF
jgi:hypothetical protein